ncbi:VOC family protein [Microtetraspora sp. NBRC 16547]|uniref:VOC family protein n=1 Tax=Microtetraspora sp. NBRC 16547 TaxID=3030993 RepID=UPI0024A34A79|nr:VOC family protein [Microtetraspora sp. NBRC 16547]GLX01632.1 hypothetical protein Misp02_57180 [Microtetraspora sp. NBRC 16547]
MRANLLVIYTTRREECRDFYASLGMDFQAEQHGNGPEHYAAVLPDGMVFEIYPAAAGATGTFRIGFAVESLPGYGAGRHVLHDPDGRAVELHVER